MTSVPDLPVLAERVVRAALSKDPERCCHSVAVARTAAAVADSLPSRDGQVLIAAAYLHDVGQASSLKVTGHHGLDGALHLDGRFPDRVVTLVAHHSESRWEADLRGLAQELAAFTREESIVADALTYCDMTTGPTGQRVSLAERLADVSQRYGPDHVVSRSVEFALPYLTAAVTRVQRELLDSTPPHGPQRSTAASPPAR